MAIQLKIDEMLEFLEYENNPRAQTYQGMVEALALALAKEVEATVPNLTLRSEPKFEGLGFAGTCAAFEPTEKGLQPPKFLEAFELELEEWYDLSRPD